MNLNCSKNMKNWAFLITMIMVLENHKRLCCSRTHERKQNHQHQRSQRKNNWLCFPMALLLCLMQWQTCFWVEFSLDHQLCLFFALHVAEEHVLQSWSEAKDFFLFFWIINSFYILFSFHFQFIQIYHWRRNKISWGPWWVTECLCF